MSNPVGTLGMGDLSHFKESKIPTLPSHKNVCLENGYWCPQNALRHPQDIIKYLKRKLK